MLPLPAPVVTVVTDYGGMIDQFDKRIAQYARRGTRVRIMGECDSSCTMLLRLGDRVCVGPNAHFGFHQAFTPADPKHIRPEDTANRSEEGTAVLWSSYPAEVRAWLDENGGLTPDLIVLQGTELHRLFPSCP